MRDREGEPRGEVGADRHLVEDPLLLGPKAEPELTPSERVRREVDALVPLGLVGARAGAEARTDATTSAMLRVRDRMARSCLSHESTRRLARVARRRRPRGARGSRYRCRRGGSRSSNVSMPPSARGRKCTTSSVCAKGAAPIEPERLLTCTRSAEGGGSVRPKFPRRRSLRPPSPRRSHPVHPDTYAVLRDTADAPDLRTGPDAFAPAIYCARRPRASCSSSPCFNCHELGWGASPARNRRTMTVWFLTLTITLHESIHGAEHTFIVFERWALAER